MAKSEKEAEAMGFFRQESSSSVLVKNSYKLEQEFKSTARLIRSRLNKSRLEESKQRIAAWREDVLTLSKHIEEQLRYCAMLRSEETLESMMVDSPEEALRKSVIHIGKQMKVDIWLINDVITKLYREEDSLEFDESNELDNYNQSTPSKPNRADDHAIKIEKTLSAMPLSSSEDLSQNLGHLVELFRTFLNLQSQISGKMLKLMTHHNKDKAGIADIEDAKEAQYENSTTSTALLLKNFETVRKLMSGIRHFDKICDGMDSADEITKLRQEHSRMKEQVKNAETKIKLLERTIATMNSINDPPSSAAGNLDRIKVNQLQLSLNAQETQYEGLREKYIALLQNHSRLEDKCTSYRDRYLDQEEKLQREREWYRPRIEKLEEAVLTTAGAFDSMALDTELISNMYLGNQEEIDAIAGELKQSKAENKVLTDKFRGLLKTIQTVRGEKNRQDRVIQTLMGARYAVTKNYEEMKEQLKNTEIQYEETVKLMEELKAKNEVQEQELIRTKEELMKRKLKNQKISLELKSTEKARDSIFLEKKKIQEMMESRIQAMKTAGMDTAMRQEYDEAQLRLSHSINAYEQLEGKLREANKKVAYLQSLLKQNGAGRAANASPNKEKRRSSTHIVSQTQFARRRTLAPSRRMSNFSKIS